MTRQRLGMVALAWAAGFAAGMAAPLSVQAQGRVGSDAAGLSLEQAVARALEHEPTLQSVRTDVAAARGTLVQAGLKPNPMLSMARQQEPGGSDNQTSVTVEWPLDLFRKTGRVTVAARELDVTTFRVADRERLLAADVRTAYGAAAAAIRDLAVTDEVVEAATRELELVRGRVTEGAAPPLQRDVLIVERQRVEADRLLQSTRAETTMLELKRLLGMAPAETLLLRDTLESLVDAAGSPSATDQMDVERRADVQEAAGMATVAAAAVDRARRDGRPDLSLFATYMRTDAGFPQLGFNHAGALERVGAVFHYVAAGATVTLPLRNNNRGEIAATEARRDGAEARREAAELQARTEVAAARVSDRGAQAAVAVYKGELRTLARQNLETVRRTYDLGRGTVTDVLSEQRRFLEIERAYTDTLRQAYDARTALLRAMGAQR